MDKRQGDLKFASSRVFGREAGMGILTQANNGTELQRNNHSPLSKCNSTRLGQTGKSKCIKENIPKNTAESKIPVAVKTYQRKCVVDFEKAHRAWDANFRKGKALKKKPCTQPIPFNFTQKGERHIQGNSATFIKQNSIGGPASSNHTATPDKAKTPRKVVKTVENVATPPGRVVRYCKESESTTSERNISKNQLALTCLDTSQSRRIEAVVSPNGSSDQRYGNSCNDVVPRSLQYLPQKRFDDVLCRTDRYLAGEKTEKGQLKQDDVCRVDTAESVIVSKLNSLPSSPPTNQNPEPFHKSSLHQARISALSKEEMCPSNDRNMAVAFSPDPISLDSILQNTGIKASAQLPGVHVSGPGRVHVSQNRISCMAQRVSILKPQTQGFNQAACSSSPQTPKWSVQRVPDIRHNSLRIRSLIKNASAYRDIQRRAVVQSQNDQTPIQPRQYFGKNLSNEASGKGASPEMKDLAICLFNEAKDTQEDSQSVTSCQERQHPGKTENKKKSPMDKELTDYQHKEKSHSQQNQAVPSVPPPFFQAVHRESVIMFSQGGKVCGPLPLPVVAVPQTQASQNSAFSQSSIAVEKERFASNPVPFRSSGSPSLTDAENVASGCSALQSCAAFSLNEAQARQRMTDVLLDEECAFYTSRKLDQHRFLCRNFTNPIAGTLYFQENIIFIPVILPANLPEAQSELPVVVSATS
ncbi:uncharacterized protein LOC120525179 isoform X2 [Polypterus senegalus]|uniref:uncharacterized protein LOC120525179 isoform X2 n=1 Tax=Polypterus senegalus TaxID=55291 RepID=UPI001964AA5C|nr:uncharacterized protein LOC120525179 isoform X2 [Polypterus senegalus]